MVHGQALCSQRRGTSVIPCWDAKILHAAWHSKKNKTGRKKRKIDRKVSGEKDETVRSEARGPG